MEKNLKTVREVREAIIKFGELACREFGPFVKAFEELKDAVASLCCHPVVRKELRMLLEKQKPRFSKSMRKNIRNLKREARNRYPDNEDVLKSLEGLGYTAELGGRKLLKFTFVGI